VLPISEVAHQDKLTFGLCSLVPLVNFGFWTLLDGFSKYAVACPIRHKDAQTVTKVLVERIILLWGRPLCCLTDLGTEFENELARELYKLLLGIDKLRSSGYRPQTAGALFSARTLLPASDEFAALCAVNVSGNKQFLCRDLCLGEASPGVRVTGSAPVNVLVEPYTQNKQNQCTVGEDNDHILSEPEPTVPPTHDHADFAYSSASEPIVKGCDETNDEDGQTNCRSSPTDFSELSDAQLCALLTLIIRFSNPLWIRCPQIWRLANVGKFCNWCSETRLSFQGVNFILG